MSEMGTQQKLNKLAKYMQLFGDEPIRFSTGKIVGASFSDDENGETTPRLYIDMDEDIPVGHNRVYVIGVKTKRGNRK